VIGESEGWGDVAGVQAGHAAHLFAFLGDVARRLDQRLLQRVARVIGGCKVREELESGGKGHRRIIGAFALGFSSRSGCRVGVAFHFLARTGRVGGARKDLGR
jgi:hypothetical protein